MHFSKNIFRLRRWFLTLRRFHSNCFKFPIFRKKCAKLDIFNTKNHNFLTIFRLKTSIYKKICLRRLFFPQGFQYKNFFRAYRARHKGTKGIYENVLKKITLVFLMFLSKILEICWKKTFGWSIINF